MATGIIAQELLPPPPRTERVAAMDLLRGIAILAVLAANMPIWDGSLNILGGAPRPAGLFDHGVMVLTLFFVYGKFITLLSILFGAGLAIQADKGLRQGDAYFKRPFTAYYLRRQAILFAIGLFHFLFLWFGDILTSYAIVAVLAYLVSWVSPRNLWWFIGGCLVVVFLWLLLVTALTAVGGLGNGLNVPPPTPGRVETNLERQLRAVLHYTTNEGQEEIFRDGHLGQMVAFRAAYLLIFSLQFWLMLVWYLLPCFLIGVWLLRQGVFHDFDRHRSLVRWLILVGLAVGVPLQLGAILCYLLQPEGNLHLLMLYSIGALPLSLTYLGLGLYWSHSGRLVWLQQMLQAVGRLALSNYLLQSVLCNLLFYSYGFRLYGQLGHAAGLLIVLVLTGVQIGFSLLWLRYFQIGPVEWLWRSLADLHMQPLRRQGPVGATV